MGYLMQYTNTLHPILRSSTVERVFRANLLSGPAWHLAAVLTTNFCIFKSGDVTPQ